MQESTGRIVKPENVVPRKFFFLRDSRINSDQRLKSLTIVHKVNCNNFYTYTPYEVFSFYVFILFNVFTLQVYTANIKQMKEQVREK